MSSLRWGWVPEAPMSVVTVFGIRPVCARVRAPEPWGIHFDGAYTLVGWGCRLQEVTLWSGMIRRREGRSTRDMWQ